jgi:hypothetical protein
VRDVYGAAAMKGRAPMTETLEEVAAVAETAPRRPPPPARWSRRCSKASPPRNPRGPAGGRRPRVRAAAGLPSRRRAVATDARRLGRDESMRRGRRGAASSRPRPRPPAHRRPRRWPGCATRSSARRRVRWPRPLRARRAGGGPAGPKTRFGINNLINRMTGHGDEGAVAGHAPHAELLRPPAAEPYSGPRRDDGAWTRIRNALKFLRSCGARPTDRGHNRKRGVGSSPTPFPLFSGVRGRAPGESASFCRDESALLQPVIIVELSVSPTQVARN